MKPSDTTNLILKTIRTTTCKKSKSQKAKPFDFLLRKAKVRDFLDCF